MVEHDPAETVHENEENVPCADVVHIICPVGEEPVTVAVHDVAAPTATEEGEQLTDVVVGDPVASAVTRMELEASPMGTAFSWYGVTAKSSMKTAAPKTLAGELPRPNCKIFVRKSVLNSLKSSSIKLLRRIRVHLSGATRGSQGSPAGEIFRSEPGDELLQCA